MISIWKNHPLSPPEFRLHQQRQGLVQLLHPSQVLSGTSLTVQATHITWLRLLLFTSTTPSNPEPQSSLVASRRISSHLLSHVSDSGRDHPGLTEHSAGLTAATPGASLKHSERAWPRRAPGPSLPQTCSNPSNITNSCQRLLDITCIYLSSSSRNSIPLGIPLGIYQFEAWWQV